MLTYPIVDPATDKVVGFEIDNFYLSLTAVSRILAAVPGTANVKARKLFTPFDEIHIRFEYSGNRCVVWEPFGDNSRYWIGQEDDTAERIDLKTLQDAFIAYQPPWWRRFAGDLITLNLRSLLRRPRRR